MARLDEEPTLALQCQGIEVTVFERNPELREIGAGLTLWANGVQVLWHLDLGDALAAISARFTSFECWSWQGKRLGSMRLDAIERQVGALRLGIHHADLLRLLAGAVDEESIHLLAHCVGFRQESGQVIARFADGHEQQADVLVGADGLYSVIREQLLGKAPPRYSGYTRLSGVAFFEDARVSRGISSETWGRGRRFGMLPIGSEREPVAALRAYEARRRKRSAAIIKQSALVGEIGQWEQPLLCSLRDGLTPLAFAMVLPRLFVANLSNTTSRCMMC